MLDQIKQTSLIDIRSVCRSFPKGSGEDLLVLEKNHADTGGILHLTRLLDPDQMALMETIPVPQRSVQSSVDSQFALARAFLPRARALYAQLGLDWPENFEAATRKHLETRLGRAW